MIQKCCFLIVKTRNTTRVNFVNGNFISYIYNALGQKVQKKVTELTTMPKQINYMLGGYQYTNDVLNFFPHAEGYVNVTLGRKGAIVYNYVYQYKDHLGNNRLSYTVDPSYGDLTILEESHYYPFGLKHTSYNTTKYEFVEVEDGANYFINIEQLPDGYSSAYKYKYNGKEYQDELGLNMYAMDMRQYDPAIARWVVQDPVIHFDFSTYNAFDNNPVFWADPSGEDAQQTAGGWAFTGEDAVSAFRALVNGGGSFDLKGEYSTASGPGGKFLTMDLAAIDFAMEYNGMSTINNVEFASELYKFNSDGKYSYTVPRCNLEFDSEGNIVPEYSNGVIGSHEVPKGTTLTGHMHTHGADDGGDIMRFSGMGNDSMDMYNNRMNAKIYGPEYRAYVVVPDGTLWKYTPYRPGIKTLTTVLSTDIPSDSKSSRRKNLVEPEVTPKVMPTIISSSLPPNFTLKTKH